METNYNFEDLDDESLTYVNRFFSERYKQWKNDLHHYFEAFDDPQAPAFVNKAKVNKANRKKKTLLHHSGSRPFSYRMDARRQGGPNSQRSTSLATFMFDLGMSWPNDDGGEEPVGCWVSDLDGDVRSDSREEAGDILLRDGECQAEGIQTPFISAVKQSGDCFDNIGGHSSESDVGDSAVPCTVRHSSPAF
ncbi:hypothetical protein Prudu_116S000100 [Prunus dulcis]|uniref:Uncharacterized protein n=1 Tax=Prunus dulcis TaxID=3755 RepID=A0A5H2XKP9_PRUDU|nr:hypothetical protein Prudu_116S000100 [Prunus dulcis]